jgi:hypothetical protein
MDQVGKTYGDWTVVSKIGKTSRGTSWLCRCSCGFELSVLEKRLVKLTRCQKCANKVRRRGSPRSFWVDLTGQTIGKRTVIAYVGKVKRAHIWRVRCECGRERDLTHAAIRRTHMCFMCANKERALPLEERRRRMLARGVAKKKEQRMSRWESGECTKCPRPRLPDLALCEFHRAIGMELSRVYKMTHIPYLRQRERETRPPRKAK